MLWTGERRRCCASPHSWRNSAVFVVLLCVASELSLCSANQRHTFIACPPRTSYTVSRYCYGFYVTPLPFFGVGTGGYCSTGQVRTPEASSSIPTVSFFVSNVQRYLTFPSICLKHRAERQQTPYSDRRGMRATAAGNHVPTAFSSPFRHLNFQSSFFPSDITGLFSKKNIPVNAFCDSVLDRNHHSSNGPGTADARIPARSSARRRPNDGRDPKVEDGSLPCGTYVVSSESLFSHPASERLDRSLSKELGISRTLAASYFIRGHRVLVNETACTTPSRRLRSGDKVTYFLPSSHKPRERNTEEASCERADDTDMQKAVCRDGSAEFSDTSAPAMDRQGHSVDNLADPDSVESVVTDEVPGNVDKASPNGAAVMRVVKTSPVGRRSGSDNVTHTGKLPQPNSRIGLQEKKYWVGVYSDADRSLLTLLPDEKPLDVLYEDDDIVVINKPAGLLTHPPQLTVENIDKHNRLGSVVQRLFYKFLCSDGMFPETFLPLAKQAAFRKLNRNGCTMASRKTEEHPFKESIGNAGGEAPVEGPRGPTAECADGPSSVRMPRMQLALPEAISRPVSIVHRLDIGTSGALVAAKTAAAAENLKLQWAERKVLKGYIGLCTPEIHSLHEVDAPLRRHPTQRGRMEALSNESRSSFHDVCDETAQKDHSSYRIGAKPGVSVFAPLGGNGAYGMFAALALTGRTHQIRAHLEYIGHPLLGDLVYGNQTVNEELRRFVKNVVVNPRHHREEAATRMTRKEVQVSCCDAGPDVLAPAGNVKVHMRPFLHAYFLRFAHPRTGAAVNIKALPPADICQIAGKIGVDWELRADAAFERIHLNGF
uniref:RNA pseudouridine synthase superfamily protein n=1 Tax=Toxoplasma gondii COUG TaxID=1074873 RepID=A0A2G8Y551_TOXGO|nr:RNA pseudouridine synthase superfamily protein [Toxoplasma gondii COUG]